MEAVTGPMARLSKASGVAAIVNLKFVPFGNSYFATDECGGGPYDSTTRHCWAKRCVADAAPPPDCFGHGKPLASVIVTQHGFAEYQVNRYEACAWQRASERGIGNWATRFWPYVVCLEEAFEKLGRNASTAELHGASTACALVSGLAGVEECFTGAEGDVLVRQRAAETVDHPGTPWITVNGRPTDPMNVQAAVCAAYQGPKKPAGCTQVPSSLAALPAANKPAALCA